MRTKSGAWGQGTRLATVAHVCLLALIWGSTFLLIKISLRGLTAVQITFLRMVIGAGFLLLVLWFLERKRLPRSRTLWVHLAISAALANAIPYLLFTVAEQEISSSSAGIINCTTPLWTMVIAW